jgi:hypothetical protein
MDAVEDEAISAAAAAGNVGSGQVADAAAADTHATGAATGRPVKGSEISAKPMEIIGFFQ